VTSRRVALVTGSSRGIGRGIATALAARAGYDIVVNYTSNLTAAEHVVAELEATGVRALAVRADVSLAEDRARLVEAAYAEFGRVDLLVNNAGVAPSVRADILDAGEESFDRVLGINLKGPYFLTQQVARRMIEQGGEPGKIVIVSSVSAYAASVNRGDYCLAKAGLAMMTALYAARLAEYGINVYEVRPGIVATDMTGSVKERYDRMIFDEDLTPIRRWGQPDDVGRAVVAVAGDLLSFSTGQVIDVDGGFHLRRL
jgi:NAD(P)-dependent dehydrogenase (short-subunit alcohol dehydrogenase family)